ncbi:YheT family hydrolase [Rhodopirellula sp. MGV]|uniref:YheT family hydrolase n=1 Tax=Rhodopirellula sp. MGV TaxID=2023130 RepID=UPI001304588E|nr:alpha/beta fold hydrolase [Rhodopirellula sp. MGV]
MMAYFDPPPFFPSRWYRGGALQTVASLRRPAIAAPSSTKHELPLSDGDRIVLHQSGNGDGKALLLFHGLSGCHQSPYMIRWTSRFYQAGWTVYRVDGRGCGDARDLARGISHAGRSEDVQAAFEFVAERHPSALLHGIGVSLGGNQLLRMLGHLPSDDKTTPEWADRIAKVAAVCPPIDLARCCKNMLRPGRRIYNRYFIRALLRGLPDQVRNRSDFQKAIAGRLPRTLYELDDRLTAPLSGFENADDYYLRCSSIGVLSQNRWPTLLIASEDDPIVPVGCFAELALPSTTQLLVTPTGGHAGFVDRLGGSWLDECLYGWLEVASNVAENGQVAESRRLPN